MRCPQLAGHSTSTRPLRVNQNTDKPISFVPLHVLANMTHTWNRDTNSLSNIRSRAQSKLPAELNGITVHLSGLVVNGFREWT